MLRMAGGESRSQHVKKHINERFLVGLLVGPQCYSLSACVHWPWEMHEQEFAV